VINNFYMGWSYAADPYLSVIGVDMFISQADAESGASAWMVRLNAQNDSFFGNDYNDVIRAGFGDDLVVGYAGNDILMGDDGNDTLGGGAGYDLLNGAVGTIPSAMPASAISTASRSTPMGPSPCSIRRAAMEPTSLST